MNSNAQIIAWVAGAFFIFISTIGIIALLMKSSWGIVDKANVQILGTITAICGVIAMCLFPQAHLAFGIFLLAACGASGFSLLLKTIVNSADNLGGRVLLSLFFASGAVGAFLVAIAFHPIK